MSDFCDECAFQGTPSCIGKFDLSCFVEDKSPKPITTMDDMLVEVQKIDSIARIGKVIVCPDNVIELGDRWSFIEKNTSGDWCLVMMHDRQCDTICVAKNKDPQKILNILCAIKDAE